ncbi:MAG: FAD binding domain-containing protein [Firmicutes bacterium]|nr:FAD binding domain-containing protein [Bacillota bacterium]
MNIQAYLTPRIVEECLELLKQHNGEARLIAGGTDLMLWLKRKKYNPKVLIDITEIEKFSLLRISNRVLEIGAADTHAKVALHPKVRALTPVLAEACASVGSPQIRNVATVVGNVVSAQPAADAAVALVALGAYAEIISPGGTRTEPVEELYAGVGRYRVDSTREIVSRVFLKVPGPGSGSAFMRFAPRKALSLPVVNVAVVISTEGGLITEARITVGPVADRPFRPLKAESFLSGVPVNDERVFHEAAELANQDVNPRDSLLRGSSQYRHQLVKVLVRRTLQAAAERAAAGRWEGLS